MTTKIWYIRYNKVLYFRPLNEDVWKRIPNHLYDDHHEFFDNILKERGVYEVVQKLKLPKGVYERKIERTASVFIVCKPLIVDTPEQLAQILLKKYYDRKNPLLELPYNVAECKPYAVVEINENLSFRDNYREMPMDVAIRSACYD